MLSKIITKLKVSVPVTTVYMYYWWNFAMLRFMHCTPHHHILGLHLKMAPYPIFGPLRALHAHLLYALHSCSTSILFHPLLFPCSHSISTILYYTIDSHTSPPNGHVTLWCTTPLQSCLTWHLSTITNTIALIPLHAQLLSLSHPLFISWMTSLTCFHLWLHYLKLLVQ